MKFKTTVRLTEPNIAVPWSVRLAVGGMLVVALCTAVRIINLGIDYAFDARPSWGFLIVILATVVMATFFPLLAAQSIRQTWRGALVVVSVVGLRGAFEPLAFVDVLAFVTATASIVAVIAAWTGSARAYAFVVRAARGSSKP